MGGASSQPCKTFNLPRQEPQFALRFLLLLIVLPLLLIHSCLSVQAQRYYFEHLQAENGLSHNTVLSLLQDKRGFLWIGTRAGLNRFDGNIVKNFEQKSSLFNTIGNTQIFDICQDKNDLIWFATSSGLCFYDPILETFKTTEKVKKLNINKVVCGYNNILWLINNDRVFSYDHAQDKLTKTEFLATTIDVDQFGNLWMGNRLGQLKMLDRRTSQVQTHQVLSTKYADRFETISKILVHKSQILIGTEALGFLSFDIATGKTNSVLEKDDRGTEIHVRDIISGKGNNFWIASENGVFKYNSAHHQITHVRKTVGDAYSLTDNSAYALCEDNQGGIWVGTFFGGVNYYSKQTSYFEKYYPLNNRNSISGNAVREISSWDGRNVWIGTEDAGLNKLDTLTGKFINYTVDTNGNTISYPNIHGLLAEKDNVYIGPLVHGLDVLDVTSGKVIKKFPAIDIGKNRHGNFVMSICRTSTNKLLLGTMGKGLLTFDEDSNKFRQVDAIPPSSYVYSLMEDHSGTIWTGSFSRGAFYFNPVSNTKGNIGFKGKHGLKEEIDYTIGGILEDKDNRLWFATDGGGLVQLNQDRKGFRKYTMKDGLPTDNLYRILEDQSGNLWISSLKGLICFNPKTKRIRVFTQKNGLLTNQFNYNSAYKAPNGKMYFGSVKGMIAFQPSSFDQKLSSPPLYITNFQVDNKDLVPQMEHSPLHKSILITDSIVLNHDQSNFNIEFAAINFSSPGAIGYRYIMEGLDKAWTRLDNNRKAYFTDLSPGTYTFRVIAESNIGAWKPVEKKIFIKILPPIWQSWLAYLFYIILAAILVYALMIFYKNDLKNKNGRRLQLFELKKEREVYQAKIEFFTTIAHEIQTPLTLIKGPIGWAIEKSEDARIKKNLRTVEKNTDRLLNLTTHLLDFRKAEINQFGLSFVKQNIPALIREQVDFFKVEALNKDISIILSGTDLDFNAFIDKEAFTKIIVNLISNALKYADSYLSIKLNPIIKNDKCFVIRFVNDGETIDKDEELLIFKPFFRAKNGKGKRGTGIGLSLARSLTQLHNGDLQLISSSNQNTIFELSIPIRQKFEFSLGK